ncbi:MAG: protein-methionine-sulfoxide reductase catalytic subunit MsrP [Acidobacteria bacterium]|nr:protein-methionine-sulfoxide reductase catalytic subunit MsrP [Acidobacteriota bacterium]
MLIKIPKGWEIPEREATPESVYLNRRQWLQAAGFLGAQGLLAAATESKSPYPAKRNPEFAKGDHPITEEWAATGYNNFYEFDPNNKEAVKDKVGAFVTSPWTIEVTGLVNKKKTLDVEELVRTLPLEERVYRFRCVEAWSMTVPWTGFPMSELIKLCDPKPNAKYVRWTTVNRPDQMPGIKQANWYPWPYFEALRLDEAMNPLAMIVTGLYGKPLPKQNGAPIRVITPWKYGYKSAKSIVKIEFTSGQPETFWHKLQPLEYGFYSNVNPHKPHPRWSQAFDKIIPRMERVPTPMYNGYEKWVGGLYKGDPDKI